MVIKIKDDVDLNILIENYGFKKKVKYITKGLLAISKKDRYVLVHHGTGYSAHGEWKPSESMYNSQKFHVDDHKHVL